MAPAHPTHRVGGLRAVRPTRLVAALVSLVVLAGAAGCGVTTGSEVTAGPGTSGASGSDTTPATSSTVVLEEGSFDGTGGAVFLRDAAAATSEVTTQKMAMTMSMADMPMMGDVVITYEGAFDNESGQGHMTIDMGDLVGSLGEGADSGRMEMVIDGDTVYIRSDLYASFTDGKPWVKVTGDEFSSGEGMGAGGQSDPAAFLQFLEGVGSEIETVGREDLRGVSTTHVRTTVDIRSLLEEASSEDRAELEESLEGLGAAGRAFESIPVEAWVDDDGYVRRFTMDFELGGMGPVSMFLDIEMYDFNEPVQVEIPDPSQVGEMTMPADSFGN